MCDLSIKLSGKTMGNSSNGNSGSDRIKSDRGGSIGKPMGDAAIGQNPESTSKPPKPPHNPHK